MGERREVAAIYWHLVGARLRADWEYRASTAIFFISQLLITSLDLLVVLAIFGQVDQLAGWTLPEVALLYGVAGTAFNLADVFASQAERASRRIKEGTFDLLLVRPLGTLVQLSAYEFEIRRVGRIVQAVAVLFVAVGTVEVDWTVDRVGLLLLTVAAGAVIFGSIWVVTSSIAFWTVDTQEVANSFTYGGVTLSEYPLEVLGPWLRRLVTFIVPLAFVAYLPVSHVLGRTLPFGLPSWVGYASPLVAAAAAVLARSVWAFAVRHHRSTGS